MRIFMDTEFTGLHKNTTLISIGCISEDGRTFYGECSDYDKTQVNDWIVENVIDKLEMCKMHTVEGLPTSTILKVEDGYGFNTKAFGTSEDVSKELRLWLFQFDTVEFVADVCHYDFVLLIDLLAGEAFNLPSFISPYCHDINQDIANYYCVSDTEAFDMCREDLVELEDENKHNALHDAKVCREIYHKLNKVIRYE